MSCIFSWNAIFPQLLLAHFAIANQTGVFSTRGTLGADGLLKLYNLHWIPLKKYTSLHYEWKVYCKSLHHGSTSVYEEYIECIYFSLLSEYPNFRRKELRPFRKIKSSACNIAAIFWNNCSKILRPNFPEKMNGECFEKVNIKTVILYNNISLCQTSVNLENIRLWNQIWPKEW